MDTPLMYCKCQAKKCFQPCMNCGNCTGEMQGYFCSKSCQSQMSEHDLYESVHDL